MTEANSRKLFIAEFILFVVPTTLLWVYGALVLMTLATSGNIDASSIAILGIIVVISLCIISLWMLGITFMRTGPVSLNQKSGFLWSFLVLGIVYTLIGLIVFLVLQYRDMAITQLLKFFTLGSFGVLLLVPATHLYLESKRGR